MMGCFQMRGDQLLRKNLGIVVFSWNLAWEGWIGFGRKREYYGYGAGSRRVSRIRTRSCYACANSYKKVFNVQGSFWPSDLHWRDSA
jgi:hypothetical protein